MVTLHELDFPPLRVTDLQSAGGGNTHNWYPMKVTLLRLTIISRVLYF